LEEGIEENSHTFTQNLETKMIQIKDIVKKLKKKHPKGALYS
jgi:hypothetical protein